MTDTRRLKVFLCHASQDKPAVRELYKRLAAEKWIDPWLDEENLLPGQDFDLEIYKAARILTRSLFVFQKYPLRKRDMSTRRFGALWMRRMKNPKARSILFPCGWTIARRLLSA
ncbi:MAG: toll/interleukin-1 receptor domain-containing protein [Anaerolineales bacterium]|nr:toll/interleukin-1 receptor domain-containing protein [Anaerolineales bacterium]